MPVAEAMVQGTPVITSRGTSTAEVAGGAAVLVDPLDVDDIAAGLTAALGDRDRLHARRPGACRGADVGSRDARRRQRVARATVRGSRSIVMVRPSMSRSTCCGARRARSAVPRSTSFGSSPVSRELDSDVAPTLCCTPAFAGAHPDLATLFPMRSPRRLGGRRPGRIVAEHTWLARQTSAVRRRPPRRWHGAADRTPADPADRARPAVPRAPAVLLTVRGCATCGSMMPRSVARASVVATPSEFVRGTVIDAFGIDAARVVVVPHGVRSTPIEHGVRSTPTVRAGRRVRRASATGSATGRTSCIRRSPIRTRTIDCCST